MLKTKKITFIIGSLRRGGAERVISILANDYISRGWEVDVILLLFNEVNYEINSKVNIIDFTFGDNSRLKRLPSWILNLRKYAKENNPDVVVSFAARINIITLISCLGLNKKVFISERNDPMNDGRSKFVVLLTRFLYPISKGIVFQTEYAKSKFPNYSNSVIISNPISIPDISRKKINTKIVNVGRLTEQKNQILLIEAFASISKKYPDFILEIYGEGELKDNLERLIKDLNLIDKVLLKGNVSDIHNQISDAMLFVLSSNYEGLSNALLEALMLGIPCISTNCSGIDQYIKSGENGLLVPINDKIKLIKAMEKMILDDELREKCSINGINMSREFSLDTVLNKWHEFLEKEVTK